MKYVLNVGGGPSRQLPEKYNGWTQHLLDIDPVVQPDICCDALLLDRQEAGLYDAVFCSHNLEHFYKHQVPQLLHNFKYILKDEGFAEIAVPNIQHLMQQLASSSLDIDDVWYRVGGLPITFHDVLYGWNVQMSQGNEYYSHKCGFTPLSLQKELVTAGFGSVFVMDQGPNILALAYKQEGVPCP